MHDTVLAALTTFLVEHQYCGELDGGRDDETVWLECICGARTAHPATVPPPLHIEAPYVDERPSR
jgi:hypothetical protein